jgi:hypothetical protein
MAGRVLSLTIDGTVDLIEPIDFVYVGAVFSSEDGFHDFATSYSKNAEQCVGKLNFGQHYVQTCL